MNFSSFTTISNVSNIDESKLANWGDQISTKKSIKTVKSRIKTLDKHEDRNT